jgi:AcrR family transcriptional regulator
MPKSAKTTAAGKRAMLVEQAARVLSEVGYANVSLRDIARASGVSLGILHYYFASKEELLTEVITSYKDHFIARLEKEVLGGGAPEDWLERLLALLRQALQADWKMHRLWYDLQAQAMFHPVFREQVNLIRSRFIRLIERFIRALAEAGMLHLHGQTPAALSSLLFAQLDGLMFHALLAEADASADRGARFEQMVRELLAPYLTERTKKPER